ncbi:hypothetical protein A1O1_07793 [Capronia coronata CBS 617.96]|uniref:Pentacotripeptide-repeat region of PRORP domain-containing protein n=1 Tax=Capronia coronata CBS 617.96 TaxID=1182541 RepID=W9XNC0_9EURO|nr:uncharacterized protein A1O1_07793 [Capronia coronata CBS 617.96]EXJ81728.1 hypothetical protein A1O1_07793 [Capronia coronata CBS 617.96]
MLERASSCVEPVSHLLLRRLEPPVRSRRILGPTFWRNEADELSVPHWWPLYLDNIRGKSASRGRLERERYFARSRHPAEKAKYSTSQYSSLVTDAPGESPRARARPTRREAKEVSKARRFNTNSLARVDFEVEKYVKSLPDSQAQASPSSDIDPTFADGTSSTATIHDEKWIDSEVESVHEPSSTRRDPDLSNVTTAQTVNDAERQLRRMLRSHGSSDGQGTESKNFEAVWALFKRLPDQEAYAAQVFHLMSSSTAQQHLKVALRAFKLIPPEKRSATDYERAARTAIQRNDYRQAISINAEATSREANHHCSAFLLLHTASHQLWNAAAQIWSTSFEPLKRSRQRLSTSLVGEQLLKQADKYQNLPLAISNLAKEITDRRAVVMHQAGILLQLGRDLLHILVTTGRLMSAVEPALLISTLDYYEELQSLNPTVHLDAINTLLKSARRPDRGKLAGVVYHHLRDNFPQFQPPPSLYGSILSILSNEGAPFEVYMYYLRQFAYIHGAADKKSYQKVLTALAGQGDVDGVQAVFVELCKVHSRPTDVAYFTPLLYAYARLGDVKGTEREFERLRDWGVKPTLYCWNILLYAYARSFEPERAFDIFEKMRSEAVLPDVYTFGTLMGIVARAGDVDAVLEIIEQAQQYQIKGSYEMISGLVQSYCLNGQADIAERLAEATTKSRFEGAPVKMWNYLLRYYAFQADSEGVLRVQQSMDSLGVKPDGMTYAALMAALVVIGKSRDAAQILQGLRTSSTLTATPFHYSIVLQGYVQEGKRDEAQKMYREMVKTFPTPSPSARLAMLHLQGVRSLDAKESANHASDSLGTILYELAQQDRATKQPQPGFGRRTAVHALPSIHLEFMAGILASRGKTEQADKLLGRFESLSGSSYLDLDQSAQESIGLLTTRLIISTQQRNWDMVERTWSQVLDLAVKAAAPFSGIRKRPATDYETFKPRPAPTEESPTGIDLIGGPEFSFTSMISPVSSPATHATDSPLDRPGLQILFSQRYILEAPITRYLRALDIQGLHQTAVELVEKLQKVGFTLSSKNWNFYIQMLTRSSDPKHWILAFKTFEERFLPNTPPWRHLRAGKWSTPSSAKDTTAGALEIFRRKTLEKLDRGHLLPTYVTAVHLAAILLESNRRATRGDSSINVELWRSAPGTYRYIRRIPRSKDRIQGGVLRGRNILGNLQKPPRRGITRQPGPSKPKLVNDSVALEAGTSTHDAEDATSGVDATSAWLPFLSSNRAKVKRKDRLDSPPVQGALYNPDDKRLEKRAEAQNRMREHRSALLDDATRHRKSGRFNPRKLEAVVPKSTSHCRRQHRSRSDSSGTDVNPARSEAPTGAEQAQAIEGKE